MGRRGIREESRPVAGGRGGAAVAGGGDGAGAEPGPVERGAFHGGRDDAGSLGQPQQLGAPRAGHGGGDGSAWEEVLAGHAGVQDRPASTLVEEEHGGGGRGPTVPRVSS